jgi:acetoin utilization deacetylase AcuC-like enzyme
MKIITDSRCTAYSSPGHPERPVRISKTVDRLNAQTEVKVSWVQPLPVAEEILERAHSPELIAQVKAATVDFDGDTPAHKDIFEHARRGAGGALGALRVARDGEAVFSLLRPPGHHATRDHAMGFCYLNSIAIAVLEALASGEKKVAVFDFDVHHGNGTEAVLVNHPASAFFSVHQHPCYPGTGTDNVGKNCFNYPVAPRTPREEYRKVLARALDDLKKAGPTLVAVSAGFDAYARDPIAQETLEAEDFWWLGKSIRDLGVPTFSVLEGGYSSDLPELILAYLKGIQGA